MTLTHETATGPPSSRKLIRAQDSWAGFTHRTASGDFVRYLDVAQHTQHLKVMRDSSEYVPQYPDA